MNSNMYPYDRQSYKINIPITGRLHNHLLNTARNMQIKYFLKYQ